MNTRKKGEKIEKYACYYLKKQGLTLITKNYFTKFGEIDLIMIDNDCLVFIEVRYRQNDKYVSGFQSITTTKKQRIIKTAKQFINQNPKYWNFNYRFDVISTKSDLKYTITWWQKLRCWHHDLSLKLDWIQGAINQ